MAEIFESQEGKLTTNKTCLKSNSDKSKEIIQIQHKVSGMGNIKKKLIDMKETIRFK